MLLLRSRLQVHASSQATVMSSAQTIIHVLDLACLSQLSGRAAALKLGMPAEADRPVTFRSLGSEAVAAGHLCGAAAQNERGEQAADRQEERRLRCLKRVGMVGIAGSKIAGFSIPAGAALLQTASHWPA